VTKLISRLFKITYVILFFIKVLLIHVMLMENYEEFVRNINGYLQTKSCPRLLQAAGLQILRVQNCKQVVDCNSRNFGS
jgi:hypothetical protein